jgi:Na+/H+ antiporter NhaD/arsenite permease-like protein
LIVGLVFVLTYVGMATGGIPGLKTDRTAIALMAVAALLATGVVSPLQGAASLDGPTLVLLFALMLLSAQFGAAGLYGFAAARVVTAASEPPRLLALTIIVAGALSALLVNDIVVYSMAPILCVGLTARGRDPRPYLVALAGAGNAGSAATLIGNPQNILIGQVGHLAFWPFTTVCLPPAVLGLASVYAAVRVVWRRELAADGHIHTSVSDTADRAQILKGVLATVVLMALFAAPIPREVAALAVVAALLVSRTIQSRDLIAAVDWQLLLLIACLFVVTGALTAHLSEIVPAYGSAATLPAPDSLRVLVPGALVLSNTIGNVPATILLVKIWPHLAPGTLYGLAILSTLAGNLLLVGSLCNIIVAERAAQEGITLSFGDFARAGVPMTLASMAAATLWLWLGGWMPL